MNKMLIDLQKQAEEIIDGAVRDFLKAVNLIAENGYFRKIRRLQPAFEILEPANSEFYEYAYFERSLEWYSRDILINQSLMELFHLFGIECLCPEKKKEVRFSNESIEDIYPFEFIVCQDNKKIGYRYTRLCDNEIGPLLKKYQLESIVQIDWNIKSYKHRDGDLHYKSVSFKEFLEEYFSELDCNLVIDKFKKAVKEANDDVGFETIPRLSLRYLSNFKQDIDFMLAHENYRDKQFMMLSDEENAKNLSGISLDEEDYKICDFNFMGNELYKSLLGNEGFAKCFVTAEYQYNVFRSGNSFDYTSVVCGYLKSIEQLIYKLLKINLDYPSNEKLWIRSGNTVPKGKRCEGKTTRKNPTTGRWQVVFEKEFEQYFNITLGPMIWFLHDNEKGWRLSDNGREKVHEFLLNFAKNCRNDYFHKDNIYDYEAVVRIRNNTILLMYLLIGGYKMSGSIENDKSLLGIQDDRFACLYKKIQELPHSVYKFIIRFSGENEIQAYRHFYQEKTKYDDAGSVISSRIKFVKTDLFSPENYNKAMEDAWSDKKFFIDRDNIPEYIAYINGRGERIEF